MKDQVKHKKYSNTTTLGISDEVFERLKRISVEKNTDMKGAVRSIINNKTGKLNSKDMTVSCALQIDVDKYVYETLDSIRKKTRMSFGGIIYCLVNNIDFVTKPKVSAQIKVYTDDLNKLNKIKKNTAETHSSILLKLLNNGEDIEYISRW
ncbi:MAG: hypothetical protein PHQ67_04020 [Fermentimonas sp.]|nr:hypothetical protein [Fermentimonas sp.]